MKPLVSILACLLSASVLAQPNTPGPGPGRGFGPGRAAQSQDEMRLRRERMQEFRQQMRNRQSENERDERPSPMLHGQGREFVNDERPRGLRRLNPDERQRLRQEMREAYRR